MSEEIKRSRRQFSTEQKVAILRRHLIDKVPVSDLSNEYKIQPSLFYYWQRLAFDNLAGALEPTTTSAAQREKQLSCTGSP